MKPLFEPGEAVQSQRLSLSTANDADVEAMGGWLAASLQPDWTLEELSAVLEDGATGSVVRDLAGDVIGLIVALADRPEPGDASLPLIAIEPSQRFSGLGGEAGLAMEKQIRARWGSRRVFAPIPDGRGLAVYFWLRLGFRPLTTAAAPWPLAGLSAQPRRGIWLVRDEP